MELSMLMSIPSLCAKKAKGSPQKIKRRTAAVVSEDIGAGSVESNKGSQTLSLAKSK